MKTYILHSLVAAMVCVSTAQAQMRHFNAADLPNADEVARMLAGPGKQATPGNDGGAPSGVRTRGIKLSPDEPAKPSQTHPADTAAAAPSAGAAAGAAAGGSAGSGFSFPVAFALGSANLAPNAFDALDRIGAGMRAMLAEEPDAVIRLEGHADASGDPSANLVLSLRRAISVRTYLSNRFGIAPNRIDVAGMGSGSPLNAGNPYASENRRVEFKRAER